MRAGAARWLALAAGAMGVVAAPQPCACASAPCAHAQDRQGSEPPRPEVASVEPASGPPGTRVIIHGSYFKEGATVDFGGAPAQVEEVKGDRIVATVGPHRPGRVSVQVTNPVRGSGALGWAFTYEAPAGGG